MRRKYLITRIACIASFLACALVPTSASASVGPSPGTISTFAGSPVLGPVSGLTIGAGGGTTGDIATATIGGTVYAYYAGAYQNVVRRINLTTGEEQVVAGNGGFGAAVDGILPPKQPSVRRTRSQLTQAATWQFWPSTARCCSYR